MFSSGQLRAVPGATGMPVACSLQSHILVLPVDWAPQRPQPYFHDTHHVGCVVREHAVIIGTTGRITLEPAHAPTQLTIVADQGHDAYPGAYHGIYGES